MLQPMSSHRFRLPPLAALAAFATGLNWPVPGRCDEIVTLEPFSVSGSQGSSTTLPERPVTGVYGFATPYQDVPRSIAQITPEQFAVDSITSVNDFALYSPSTS